MKWTVSFYRTATWGRRQEGLQDKEYKTREINRKYLIVWGHRVKLASGKREKRNKYRAQS